MGGRGLRGPRWLRRRRRLAAACWNAALEQHALCGTDSDETVRANGAVIVDAISGWPESQLLRLRRCIRHARPGHDDPLLAELSRGIERSCQSLLIAREG